MDPEDHGYEHAASYYDLFDQKPNIPFFLSFIKPGDTIIDIGAGTGRIALPLAENQCHVWAIEPSAAMRKEFSTKLDGHPQLGDRIHLHAGDAQTFHLDRQFDLALLSGTFDHLMTEAARIHTLRNIRAHLKSDGLLIFDVYLGLMEERPLSPAGKVIQGEVEIRRKVGSHVREDGLIDVTLVYETWKGGQLSESVTQHSQAATISYEAVMSALKQTHFETVALFSSFSKHAFTQDSDLLIVVAKPE